MCAPLTSLHETDKGRKGTQERELTSQENGLFPCLYPPDLSSPDCFLAIYLTVFAKWKYLSTDLVQKLLFYDYV